MPSIGPDIAITLAETPFVLLDSGWLPLGGWSGWDELVRVVFGALSLLSRRRNEGDAREHGRQFASDAPSDRTRVEINYYQTSFVLVAEGEAEVTIGQRIRFARERLAMTQEELSEVAGVGSGTIYRIEASEVY